MIRTIIVGAMLVVAAIAIDVSAEPKKVAAAVDTAHVDKKKAAVSVDTAHIDKKKAAVSVDTAHADKKKAAAAVDTAHVDKKKAAAAVDTAHADKKKATVSVDTAHVDKKKAAVSVDTAAASKHKVAAVSGDTSVTLLTGAASVDTVAAVDSMVVIYTIAGADTSGRVDNFASYGRERSYIFSARNDIMIVLGEISSVGLNLEAGLIDENGYLISLDFGGGPNYWGIGLNVGYLFDGFGDSRQIIGVSGNFHNTELVVRVLSESGAHMSTEYGLNRGFAGIFWKLMPWKTENLDITNRFLFGYKRDSAWWDEDNGEIEYKKGFSVTYSLTVGYTLMKRSK